MGRLICSRNYTIIKFNHSIQLKCKSLPNSSESIRLFYDFNVLFILGFGLKNIDSNLCFAKDIPVT